MIEFNINDREFETLRSMHRISGESAELFVILLLSSFSFTDCMITIKDFVMLGAKLRDVTALSIYCVIKI